MGVIQRLTISWESGLFAVVAALAWLTASFVSCPQFSVKSVSRADLEINPVPPPSGSVIVSIAEDDCDFQEDDLEPCKPLGAWLACPPLLTLSQIMPPESFCLSFLTPATQPLRC
jgi:hypothetical protein